ncbi:MAG: N-acetyltransferase [Methanoregula sp.]|jgi:putative acetyltransferase
MDSFFIRSEIPEDIPAIFNVNLQAFGQDGEARLVRALRNDGDYIPGLSLVAVYNDKIIGHILFAPISIESEGAHVPAVALAPLSVCLEHQCQGVGSILVEEGLKTCRQLGHRIVIVVGHPTYYPRFGFTTAPPLGINAPFPCRNEVFMVCPLVPGALDGIHGTVRYPPAFEAEGAHAG